MQPKPRAIESRRRRLHRSRKRVSCLLCFSSAVLAAGSGIGTRGHKRWFWGHNRYLRGWPSALVGSAPKASTHYHGSMPHVIVFPGASAGDGAPATLEHRQAPSTPPRGPGKNDPPGGLPRLPAALRAACDAPASRRVTLLTGHLGSPSHGAWNHDSGY
jgi:hypothetical protein